MPLLLRVLSASLLFISLLANAASLDVSKLQAGEVQYLQWHGMPVLVYKRTADEMSQLQKLTTKAAEDGYYLQLISHHNAKSKGNSRASALMVATYRLNTNPLRSTRPDIVVLLGISSSFGCKIELRAQQFVDPCSGSHYDLAGRILNPGQREFYHLLIPPHEYQAEQLIIGGKVETQIKTLDFTPDIQALNISVGEKLIEALEWHKPELALQFLKDPAVLQFKTVTGATALHLAATKASPDILEALIKSGFAVNAITTSQLTPLHFALISGQDDNAIMLLRHGASIYEVCHEQQCSKSAESVLLQFYPDLSSDKVDERLRKLVNVVGGK
jgi:Rieske Fe-S protein